MCENHRNIQEKHFHLFTLISVFLAGIPFQNFQKYIGVGTPAEDFHLTLPKFAEL